MKHFKMMKPSEYDHIKKLLALKLKSTQVSEITGRSSATVCYVKKSTDFADYHDICNKYNNKVTSVKKEVSLDNPDKRDYVVSNLDRIATALERLATAWEARPEKHTWFSVPKVS